MLNRPIVHTISAGQPRPTGHLLGWPVIQTRPSYQKEHTQTQNQSVQLFANIPLQVYICTLDYSESRENRETGYVSSRSYS